MHSTAPRATFTPAEQANLLAGKAVAHATAYLGGLHDAATLGRNARSLQYEILGAGEDLQAKAILDASRLLVVAMLGAAAAIGEVRQDRWQHLMGALVELVRHESIELRTCGGQGA
jgi:hypothetical protein